MAKRTPMVCQQLENISREALETYQNTDPIMVRTCWDADRLDLGRVGTTPWVEKLCTKAARDAGLLKWANKRGEGLFVPALVSSEWGVRLR